MSENKNLLAKKTFILALESHHKNDLQSAINLYNEVLKIDPNYEAAHNNLGTIFQEVEDHLKAIPCFEKAIQIKPNYVDALHNLGVIFQSLDQPQKAIPYFEKVIQINPNYAKAYNSLGTAFQTIEEFQKAKVCYETAIKIKPNFLKANNNLGIILNILGDNQKAIAYFEKAIQIDPDYEAAINNLGTIFKEVGDDLKAKEYFEKALKIEPNNVEALNNLGIIFKDLGENQKAKEIFEKALKLDSRSILTLTNIAKINFEEFDIEKAINSSYEVIKIKNQNFKFIDQSISLNCLKHDVGQANYISQTGGFWKFFKLKYFKIKGIDEFIKVGSKILSRRENIKDDDKKITLTPDEVNALLPFYKTDHIYKPKIISGSCINPNKNWQAVEDEYFNSEKQIIYIDDFLSEEALIELREFCLISKVWSKEYNNKYFGAFSDNGFISPIHLQIGIELKRELPKLFGPHMLDKILGFKYNSTHSKGINIYGDSAIHNLSFWVTPDEFNNNKNEGGLKVYDVPAPENWNFNDYNINNDKIHKYLEDNNANCINVPYKFNRAVLFNSAYFHETDEIDFKDKYEAHQINMTYLFGSRLAKR